MMLGTTNVKDTKSVPCAVQSDVLCIM